MKSIFILLLALLPVAGQAQLTGSYPYEEVAKRLQANRDSLLVVNFWATWCKPCVKEMPHFVKLQADYAARGVKVLLLSMDEKEHIETRVKPYLIKAGIRSEVLHISNTVNANDWINKVDPSWSGSIPATFIIDKQGHMHSFCECEVTYEKLQAMLQPHL